MQFHLLEMVEIDVRIAESVDKLARLQAAHLSHHHQQKSVTGNVERHAKEKVGAALIELEAQLAVCHIKLKHGVARGECHLVDLCHIPRAHQHTARIRVVLDLIHHLSNLVDGAAVVVGPRAPLVTIHRTEFAVFVSPLVPNSHAVLLKPVHIGVATQKPQQFVDNALQVHLFGGEQRKTVGKVAANLVAKYAFCASAGAVVLQGAIVEHMLKQVEILFHCLILIF